MTRHLIILLSVCVFALVPVPGSQTSAEPLRGPAISPHLVISQFQTGGGSGVFNDEFVEIFNRGSQPVDLNGYRLVYRSTSGSGDVTTPFAVWTTSTIIPPGGYYLIAATPYNGPTTPDMTYDPTVCSCSMGGGGGGLAIRLGLNNTGAIIDSVGWGTASNAFVETAAAPAPAVDNSQSRKQNGCQDTDNNLEDFALAAPSAPRNSASPAAPCSGAGETLFAAMSASPNAVPPGGSTLLTVTVIPATVPQSTGITVTGNLSQIGGNPVQPFFDNGTNGDAAAGDNVFSYTALVAADIPGGIRNVTAVASDAQERTVNLSQSITVNAPLPGEDPLIFGNPSNATTDPANENNFLMPKPQYTLSYNRAKGTANWVAWRLDSSWIGTAQRQDDFRPDPALPAGWYQVLDSDYSGSGYERGHMVPSGDRTNSIPNNSSTFLMTNMVPQISANNQGPWEEFESYCRTLAQQGNELYIFSGPAGNIGTIAQGRVTVPAVTWKVVVVMPNGSDDLARINKGTRAFGIIVPNQPPLDINAPWRNFRVNVNAVEHLTGLDFLTLVPKNTQELIERRRDTL